MYSPLLKESLHLPVLFSYFPLFVCAMDERKEKKNTCVLCLEKEHSEAKQMIANTRRYIGVLL